MKVGLKCLRYDPFHKFFYKHVRNPEHRSLMNRMQATVEPSAAALMSCCFQVLQTRPRDGGPPMDMSDDEWDAAYLYVAVVFQKVNDGPPGQPPPGFQGKRSRQPTENDIVYLE